MRRKSSPLRSANSTLCLAAAVELTRQADVSSVPAWVLILDACVNSVPAWVLNLDARVSFVPFWVC